MDRGSMVTTALRTGEDRRLGERGVDSAARARILFRLSSRE
jgi:hypothetical protein